MDARKRTQVFTILIGVTVSLLVLISCPNPIDQFVVGQMVDKSIPTLTISAPDNNSQYTQTMTV